MKRTKHSLSHYKLLTCDMGKLVPVNVVECLPGDSMEVSSAALVRVSPLVAPVMHPVVVRFHHWFVPHRLVWEGWEDFITGGPDGLGGGAGAYPTLTAGGTGFGAKSLLDYMGVPPAAPNIQVSAMPVRAYNLIFNEFYRDQDLVSEVTEDQTSLLTCAWEKDYFTSARPWSQKGPEVTLPVGGNAPVSGSVSIVPGGAPTFNIGGGVSGLQGNTTPNVIWATGSAPSAVANWQDPQLSASHSLTADLGVASAVAIGEVRRAFALQRYQEARAQYGSRYTEYLRYLGVRSSDARLQRPEYLGGGKQVISFSEVVRTGRESDDTNPGLSPVGELKGHGIAAMRSRRFRRFFEEHGHIITIMSVRPRTMYEQGIERGWSRRTKEDYWQKELELIGQQEIYNREVYADGTATDGEVFGYQDRYAEYRHIQSQVAAEFRSTLDYWHMARIFGSRPTLNGAFVSCDPTKRIHAEQTQDVLWCMVNNSIRARRMVGKRTIGRII